ncbi:hypothetical protein HX007_08545 [Myroides marinus]|nr:hypothetical protein [Myroides marinus]
MDANTTKVEVKEGVYTFKDGSNVVITTIDTNAQAIAFDNSTNGFTSDNVQSALEELSNTIATSKGELSIAGGLEFTGGTNGTAKLLADAGIQIADGGVTTDKIKAGSNKGDVLVTGDNGKVEWVTKTVATSNEIKADGTDIVSTVNGKESKLTLAGDVVLKGGKTVVNAIQGTPVSDTKPTANGQALVFDGAKWIPGTPNVGVENVTDAKTLSTDGVIVIGTDSNSTTTSVAKSLLAEVKLNIAKDKITTDHIANGTIQPEDIAKAGNNQVLVTGADGTPTWKDQTAVGEILTANNGLTKTQDSKIQLGGSLIQSTVISTGGGNTLALTGLDKKKTQGISATEGITQHLLAVDKNGDVIKALKAAMPKFFYMPSVMVPTAESQATQAGVSYNNATRKGTIDMYAIYKKQFGTPVMSSPGASVLPVLPASELGFHVTYATEGVFTIVSIDANGLMTYQVSATANVNVGSFINIVFSVKEDN